VSWTKLDDGFYDHPKVLRAGLEAIGLFCLALSYASRHSTDGALDGPVLDLLARGRADLVTKLVDVGLFDATKTGVVIHDFLIYNPSSREVAKRKKGQRIRVRSYRARSAVSNALPSETCNALLRDGTGREGKGSFNLALDLDLERNFVAFWARYPKKVGKQDARKAWLASTSLPNFPVMMDGLDRSIGSDQWTRDGGRYIPHPATWLRHEQWTDEPLAPVQTSTNRPTGASATMQNIRNVAEKWRAQGRMT
jgi:hypothetical protein